MSYEHVCSHSIQLMLFFLCFSGSVGEDQIYPGCHHRAEEIWRSPAWWCVQRNTTRDWNWGRSIIDMYISICAAVLFRILQNMLHIGLNKSFNFPFLFFIRCLLEKSQGIYMKMSWCLCLSLLVPSGTWGSWWTLSLVRIEAMPSLPTAIRTMHKRL